MLRSRLVLSDNGSSVRLSSRLEIRTGSKTAWMPSRAPREDRTRLSSIERLGSCSSISRIVSARPMPEVAGGSAAEAPPAVRQRQRIESRGSLQNFEAMVAYPSAFYIVLLPDPAGLGLG